MGALSKVILVVPCYNEAGRFDNDGFRRFFSDERIHLFFVDDGSRDRTGEMLRAFVDAAPERASLHVLAQNRGKAEAVRTGMLRAVDRGADAVGYIDADLATPVDETVRLIDILAEGTADGVIGARVATMGSEIARHPGRHYLGRLFATAASAVLRESVYDTQCGAKVFRADKRLGVVLSDPFVSRWAFDVELLGRLCATGANIIEVPLRRWYDVPGSKLHIGSMARSAADLVLIERDLRKRRR